VVLPYTVQLARDEQGAILVTCRELPDLLTSGKTEREALAMAEVAIAKALGFPEIPTG
jgi:predicted RNase H-like HicB family nuclease